MSDGRVFCSACGTPNEGDAAFCESCGHSLSGAPAALGSTAGASPQPVNRQRLSPQLVGLLAVLLVAGAFAFRAPVWSFLSSIAGSGKNSADSLQLKPAPQDLQLNDRPAKGQPQALAPSVLPPGNQLTSGVQPTSPRAPAVQPPVQRPPSGRSTAPSQPDLQPPNALPARPAAFPEGFKPPEGAATSGSPAVPSASGNEAPTGLTAGAEAPLPAGEPASTRGGGRIAAGSVLSLKSVDQVCTDKTTQGAKFRGVVQQNVEGSNGASIPKGTFVTFVVDRLKRASAPNEKPEFSIAAESIALNGTQSPLTATINAVAIKPKTQGLFGALLGAATAVAVTKAAGGDTKQAIAGGVAGGAAGAVIGSQLKTGDGCIEKNAPIRITLGADLTASQM